MSLEAHFDPVFTSTLALREKQIQQNYRPIIGIHKWFARRPGTVFRNLLLSEFNSTEPLHTSYWHAHTFQGVIADPFMGGGIPLVEANRLGFSVVGTDINPMAYWIVRQSLTAIDLKAVAATAACVAADVEGMIGNLYQTTCIHCGQVVPVKYFLWVKTQTCPICGTENDLFPEYLLSGTARHPVHVLLCSSCGQLNESEQRPTRLNPAVCTHCGHPVFVEGPAQKGKVTCRNCNTRYPYPPALPTHPPCHRLYAIEYYCACCKPQHAGRFFKHPDAEDYQRIKLAQVYLAETPHLPIPDDAIPPGDETNRLLRWGYRKYRDLFNERQLLGLGQLLKRICQVEDQSVRHALLTVFSDTLRYQNLLCRYDPFALKCQDMFSVHGFPVGLVQCENNLLGIPRIGAGAFRHFVEKYLRAKQYCIEPFETSYNGSRKKVVPITGEQIEATLVETFPEPTGREAFLLPATATALPLPPQSLDGVFTDPPYFNNVQYAELMDFCFVWLRLGLHRELAAFRPTTTRSANELTGNVTLKRGLDTFTAGLSAIFCHYAAALKPEAPFVFTYHHNDPLAYVPLVVAILDAGMICTATLPAAAEMSASLHIVGTTSSVLDSIFVCRKCHPSATNPALEMALLDDSRAMHAAGVQVRAGDLRCLAAGHIARMVIRQLAPDWATDIALNQRMTRVRAALQDYLKSVAVEDLVARVLAHNEVAA